MPHSDFPPPIVVGDCPEGHAELIKMVNEEPSLMGKVYECSEYKECRYPLIVDDDWLRPRHLPICEHRNRSGVRDMNLCCRCLQGLPHTFKGKWEEFSDAPIRI